MVKDGQGWLRMVKDGQELSTMKGGLDWSEGLLE
jgi:hypothetical protein